MNHYEMKKKAYESDLKNRALQVLLYLIDRSNKEGTCFPAISTIARELHISVSTVKRALGELVEAGFVIKESRFRENKGQSSNLYTIVLLEKNIVEEFDISDDKEKDSTSFFINVIHLVICKLYDCKPNYEHILCEISSVCSIFISRFGFEDILLKSWTGVEFNLIPP